MRHPRNWLDFILTDGNECAVVEALNGGGGMAEGMRFKAFDVQGNYIAIWNQCDRAVWCHKKNLKAVSKGTVL